MQKTNSQFFPLLVFMTETHRDAEKKPNKLPGKNVCLMSDCSFPQLLLFSAWFLIKHFIVYPKKFSCSHQKTQTLWNCPKKPHHLLVKNRLLWLNMPSLYIKRPSLLCLHVSLLQGKKKKYWHEWLSVNNLQGHTEHVRPTKTIPLQALRLQFSARAWPGPCFVLIGQCCRHQGKNSSQDTQHAPLKWIKLLGKSWKEGRGDKGNGGGGQVAAVYLLWIQ